MITMIKLTKSTRRVSTACVAALLAACALGATGCSETIESSRKTSVSKDGTVKTDESKTVKNPDGSVTKEEKESKTVPPPPPKSP